MPDEERSFEIKNDLKDLIKTLIGICPAYNVVSQILRDGEGKFIGEISTIYPELFDKEILPVLLGMFGMETGTEIKLKNNDIGRYLLYLIEEIEGKLNKPEMQDLISRAIGEVVPNPVRDYVEGCIKTLKEKDEVALKLALLNAKENWLFFDALIEDVKEEFGLEMNEEDLLERLKVLEDLGLLDYLREDRVSIIEKYRFHILDLASK